MNEQWSTRLSNLRRLSAEQRLHFFELLAHNLTVAARGAWSEAGLTAQEQVESLKQINECLHRVTARIRVERLNTHEWKDEDFVSLLLEMDEQLHLRLRGSIAHAFERSYATVAT
jgi:hypothetical protein